MLGRAPFRRATWSQRIADSEPVTARFGPRSSPSRSARGCAGSRADNKTAAGRLLIATAVPAAIHAVAHRLVCASAWPIEVARANAPRPTATASSATEDLEAWYLNFDFDERVLTAFQPGMTNVKQGAQTVPQGPHQIATAAETEQKFKRTGRFGHSASIQLTSRLQRQVVGPDGTVYAKGTAIPQRADFNTLDNPFAFSSDHAKDRMNDTPAAGVHFVVFNPSGDDFERNRLAMDGVLPDGKKLDVAQRSRAQGFNSVLTTTHRQNFLVPPRRHRSFPLVEL